MTFDDALRAETGALKMAVHIGGEDESAVLQALAPGAEDLKTRVRAGGAVEIQTMPVETPCQRRILGKPPRVGQTGKIEAQGTVGRIGLPEPLPAAKIRQPGID